MNNSPPPIPHNRRPSPDENPEIRRLVILWGLCCLSPIMYLMISAIVRNEIFNNGPGFIPIPAELWPNALIGLAVWAVCLQALHFWVKRLFKRKLALISPQSPAFVQLLSRRTIILMMLSEMSVFAGFCLFLCQGNLTPVFGAGLASMILYAQAHPRSGLPQ